MNNFRHSYKEILRQVETPEITVQSVLDEREQKKRKAAWRRKQFVAVAGAAGVFLLCMAGTVTAVNYTRSVIWTNGSGFSTMDEKSARMREAAEADQEPVVGGAATEGADEIIAEMELEECEATEYDSLDVLREENPELALAMPPLASLGDPIVSQFYMVMGTWVMARVETENKMFIIDQADYRRTEGHAASVVYPGGVCNERDYTTKQGFTYKLIDSRAEEDMPARIHAAVSVNGYELIVDFDGYTEAEVYQILEEMDLGVYFQ